MQQAHNYSIAYLVATCFAIVLDQMRLVQEIGRSVHKVDTLLLEERIFCLLLGGDAIELWRAQHAHIQIRVSKPLGRVITIANRAQNNLGIEHVCHA